MLRPRTRFWLAALFLAVSVPGVPHPLHRANYRADASLVEVTATVVDRQDRIVRGLQQSEFRLFEDGVEQKIQFLSEEDIPVSLAVVFDVSGSMSGRMAGARTALRALLGTSNPADEFCLITFADRPTIRAPWTSSPGDIAEGALYERSNGRTALLDAAELALREVRRRQNPRRAIVIFSDGGDNYSATTQRGLWRILEEADVQVYAVGVPDPNVRYERPAEEVVAGPNLLEELCGHAGGRYFFAQTPAEIEKATDRIGKELRSQYILGFTPPDSARDGRFHHLQVKVVPLTKGPKLTVYWRPGYRAPNR
jgi:Ca-activated chloride channel family protein